MKRKIIFVSSGVLFITLALYFFRTTLTDEKVADLSNEVTPEQVNENLTKKMGVRKSNTVTTPKLIERSIASISTEEIESFRAAFPEQIDVKTEVAENPHRTPKSLINFAEKMGPLVEKSLQNSDDATLLVDEFFNCALTESVAQTARALCLSNGEKLARIYPQLKEKIDKMRSNSPAEVIDLVNSQKLLIRNKNRI